MRKNNRLFLFLFLVGIPLAGCGVGVLLGGTPNNFAQHYTGTIKTWNSQIKKTAKEVCTSMNGKINTMVSASDVNSFQCETGTDMSSMSTSLNLTYGTGKINTTKINAKFNESRKKIEFTVTTSANYGLNVERENEERMSQFRDRLQDALKQQITLEKIE